jgi:serine/threonine-protein kinase
MALKAGDSLGRFQVIGPLGSGGMGNVYRARDIDLGRDVALKILSDRHRFDALRVERFKREARMLAALNHPGISTLFDVEVVNGVHALVMELVEGRTVADLVAGARALPMKRALEIARNVAKALEAAHNHGVVHRDLKPANIMV